MVDRHRTFGVLSGIRASCAAQVFAMLLTLAGALAPCRPAVAMAVAPHELVESVVGRVMSRIGEADVDVLAVFEQELAPHLDFAVITRWLVGEKWTSFSAAEHDELVATVRSHILRVYASLLARGREIDIAIEQTSTVLTRSATVAAHLALPDRRVPVEFRLVRNGDDWKLYDLVVEGLSFARSLRAELAPVIDAGGVSGLKTYLNRPR